VYRSERQILLKFHSKFAFYNAIPIGVLFAVKCNEYQY